ncbi:MAG: hypothetical protein ACLRZ2_01325 [Veillonella sp.]
MFGGEMDDFLYLAKTCGTYLKTRPIAFEIGFDQAVSVKALLEETGQYSNIQCIADLGGNDRVVTAVYEG